MGEANNLQQQLTALRSSELVDKEQHHIFYRENWQRETARLAEIRNARDTLARQQSDLQRQVADRWRCWRPMWAVRLRRWSERATALSDATVKGRQLTESVEAAWDLLRQEQEARADVLRAIHQAQTELATLADQVSSIEDIQ